MKTFTRQITLSILFALLTLYGTKSAAQCQAGFTWTQATANVISFTNTSIGASQSVSYYWNFGDNHTSFLQNPQHTYSMPGTYYTCLFYQDSDSCSSIFCDSIVVTGSVICSFNVAANVTAHPSCGTCADGAASSSSTGGTPPYTYSWSNGATTSSVSGLLPGTYSVCVTDASGCTDCSNTIILDTSQCHANFTWSQLSPTYIQFTNTSTGTTGSTNYYWTFGDSHVSSATNPLHYYITPGSYNVCLHISDTSSGYCNNTYCSTITVAPFCNLMGSAYESSPASCYTCADGAAYVTPISGGTPPYTYSWSTGATTDSISGLLPGNYSVTITDATGCSIHRTVTVHQPCTLVLNGYENPASCSSCSDGSAYVIASGGNSPYSYSWSTGATTSSISNIPPGMYGACVTDAHGCHLCDTIIVSDSVQCAASFYLYPDTMTLHTYYAVNTSSASSWASWLWNWGDGNYDYTQYPTHTYANAGFYQICLTITDSNCTSTFCDTEYVSRPAYPGRYFAGNELNSIVTINVIPPIQTGIQTSAIQTASLYPNPVTSTLTVSVPGNKNTIICKVYSLQGSEIINGTLTGQQITLNLGEFDRGIYVLELRSNDGLVLHKKFVKQ
jgi:PKD repeat protein